MISSTMVQNSAIPVLEQVVNFAQSRHNLLAGNVANMDTPGYRVRDLSPARFEELLSEAIRSRDAAGQGSIARSGDRSLSDVRSNLANILYHDDSNVSIEHQVAEISKNQMQHNLALTILTSQFRLLEAAISERP